MDNERYNLFYDQITSLQPNLANTVDEVEFLMLELNSLTAVIQDYKHDINASPEQIQRAEALESLLIQNLKDLIIQTSVLCFIADIEQEISDNN